MDTITGMMVGAEMEVVLERRGEIDVVVLALGFVNANRIACSVAALYALLQVYSPAGSSIRKNEISVEGLPKTVSIPNATMMVPVAVTEALCHARAGMARLVGLLDGVDQVQVVEVEVDSVRWVEGGERRCKSATVS